uniref:Uncharacterized protein n=1 Tax=viral metagenome TaxID=1070528 RepID=A0A6H1ZIC3_9ZZZZ
MLESVDPMERQNDAIIQSSCDRRTLATIAIWLRKNGEPVGSASSVVRLGIERLREIIITHFGAEDIETSDDATDILKFVGAGKINPAGRNVATYVKKMELENAVFEGSKIDSILSPARDKAERRKEQARQGYMEAIKQVDMEAIKRAINQGQEQEPHKYRKPDNMVVETLEEATARRKHEDAELKTAMSAVPADIVIEEEDNAD